MADNDLIKELEAEEEKTRSALVDAIFAWGTTRMRVGYAKGHVAGRAEARNALTKLMEEAASAPGMVVQGGDTVVATGLLGPTPATGLGLAAAMLSGDRRPSNKGEVFEAIKKNPGLRGVALLRAMYDGGSTIHERSFRTALHRLKRDLRIVNFDGGWYTAEAAPKGLLGSDYLANEQTDSTSEPNENGGQQ